MKLADMTPEARAKKQAQNQAAKERQKQKRLATTTTNSPLSSPSSQSQSASPLQSIQSQSSAQPVLLAAVDADNSSAAPRKPSRDEKEYTKLLEDYLGPATGFIILLACLVLRIPNGEEVADHLAMNASEQELIIEPLARLLDKQHFDSKVKTAIVSSGDMVGLVLGLGAYGLRVASALQTLKGGAIYGTRGNVAQQAPSASNGYNGNGHLAGGVALAGLGQYTP